MCAILNAFFFHLELNEISSPVWLNSRSVTAVVKFIKVFIGDSHIVVAESILKRFTLPILLPVASKLPFGLKATAVVLKAPVSYTLPMHLRIDKSH